MGNKRRSDAKRIQNLLIILAILTEFDISVKKPHFVLTCGIRQVKVQKGKTEPISLAHRHIIMFRIDIWRFIHGTTKLRASLNELLTTLEHSIVYGEIASK